MINAEKTAAMSLHTTQNRLPLGPLLRYGIIFGVGIMKAIRYLN
jgi:hypothetical protein